MGRRRTMALVENCALSTPFARRFKQRVVLTAYD
jgi:hypothetical protein